MIKLNLDGIADSHVKDAFESLLTSIEAKLALKGKWEFKELVFKATGGQIVPHSLNIKPKDMIVLSSTAGTVTMGSQSFTSVGITTTGVGTARILIGTYKED